MTTSLNSAIVRIRAPSGTVVGTGFLVTGRHVLTCAHVVTSALGLSQDPPNPPKADLHLDFPLLAPESNLTARLSHWQPAIDVAVLELITAPPAESKPVRLVTADDLWGHSFRALGFPAGYEQGVWASGVLRGPQADGWLQIEDTKETGYLIAPGFSGGPVWDDVLGGVVGMIVAADTDEKVKAAFLIPADVLAETLPDLVLVQAYVEWAQAQLDADMDQLRARRDQADEARREKRERQRVVNLRPLDVTHTFKDRVREVQALCDHLTDSSVRLVSVVGRGGMGKTALVSRVLGDLERGVLLVSGEERELPIDGILYLSARSTSLGLERIYADVGRMLGEPTAGKLAARWVDRDTTLAAKVEYLLETMWDGLYLILLDNLEDYLTEDGEIAEEGLRLFVERCLTQPSGTRLVVTSREEVRLTPAALHGARSIPLHEGLPEEDAIALLRDLDPQGMLGLRGAPEDDLRRAARFTRGIPHALEIMAGILHRDPTASLSHLLADERLFGKQVVERLVAEGYSRLRDDERRVMEALAVFDRPVGETAVAYLLYPWFPGLDARACLHRLVSSYFVSASRVTGEYSLHSLDQEYAYHQLLEGEEPDAYNRRNLELRTADFYASICKPESEWKTIDDLAPQLTEFEHRVRAGDYDGAYQVLEPANDYLFLWGHCARLIEMREKLLGRLTVPYSYAVNLGRLGLAYYYLGQAEQSINLYEQALIIARETGDRWREGAWLGSLSNAYSSLGQFERAVRLYEQTLVIAREMGDRVGEGRYLGYLGKTYHSLGQIERATKFYEEALAIARETGNRRNEGVWLGYLGWAYRALGQFERSINICEEALIIAREIRDRAEEGRHLGNLGSNYRALGQIVRAIGFYEEALAIAREIGYRRVEGIWLGCLGIAYRDLGQIERAINIYEDALAIARETGDRWNESNWLGNLGIAYRALGQFMWAISICEEALAIACEIGDRAAEGRHLSNLGSAYCALERIVRAIGLYEEALAIARETGERRWEAHRLLELSKAMLAAGEFPEARRRCAEALALDAPGIRYQEALTLGIVLLHQCDLEAGETFADAVTRCRMLLDRTPGLYKPRYALATALVGQAVCDPCWAEEHKRVQLLTPALAEYRCALENCAAPGVVRDALRDLELIRAAGVEGLEPVFELLEGAR